MRGEILDFYNYLVLKGRSRDTAYQNARYIYHFLNWAKKAGREVTREDILRYLTYLRDVLKYNDSTISNICYTISQFMEYLGKHETAMWVPRPTPKWREAEWLPEEVISRVIRRHIVLRVAYELALRVSEVLLLKRSEYNRETGVITVYRLKHKGKPNKYVLKLSDEARRLLNEYLDKNVCPDDRMFCMSRKKIQQIFKRALARSGLDPSKYTFHVLRHSRCTNIIIKQLRERGVADLVTVAKFMGHLDPKTTMTYIHIASKYLGRELPVEV